ncbi:unnamed protein product [Sphenostylis stenocarpa]|uniref:MnmG N-terminal domain-containing protein n=1 Tax=Sphenostylis stenocarpa TaxID=92480 RepID=A0AA86SLA6_9FABA|nr:unnamed protein product [Sphenostylis stenocarpa]
MTVAEEDTKRKGNSKDQRHSGQATNPSEDGRAIKECNSWASGARKTMSTQKLSFSAKENPVPRSRLPNYYSREHIVTNGKKRRRKGSPPNQRATNPLNKEVMRRTDRRKNSTKPRKLGLMLFLLLLSTRLITVLDLEPNLYLFHLGRTFFISTAQLGSGIGRMTGRESMIPGRKLAFSYDRLYHTLPLSDVGLALPSDLRQSYMYLAYPCSLLDESAGLMNREFRELGATLNLKSLICIPVPQHREEVLKERIRKRATFDKKNNGLSLVSACAGCEAAASAARCGSSTLLITRNPDPFGEEKCLVSRGVAKGILLKKNRCG